jgi:hypothetical protein
LDWQALCRDLSWKIKAKSYHHEEREGGSGFLLTIEGTRLPTTGNLAHQFAEGELILVCPAFSGQTKR